jgi:hypothetical protein
MFTGGSRMESKQTVRGVRRGVEESPELSERAEGNLAVTVQRTGGIWYVEGHPEVDERGLTEEIARVKADRVVIRLREDTNLPNEKKEFKNVSSVGNISGRKEKPSHVEVRG